MRFINFAIVRFSGCLAAGILTARFFPVSFPVWGIIMFILLGTFVCWLRARRQLIQKIYFGSIVYLSFFAIGYGSYQMKEPAFQTAHYTKYITADSAKTIQIKIRQAIKPDKFYTKYLAKVQTVDGRPATGKILLKIAKDSMLSTYKSDAVLLVYAPILKIPPPRNPHQFDYRQYLKNLEVYGQVQIEDRNVLVRVSGASTFFGLAQNLRAQIVTKLEKTSLTTDERAIIQALILGEKSDIGKTLYQKYAAAGAVHILAVSGLHVGIIFLILSFLCRPLNRWKSGPIIRSLIIVVALWAFAFLSGLSPSVIRAVTMFSFFAMASLLGRRTNAINTMFLSFLTLLIVNPLWLFQIGFQMSYSAVFFILWIYPLLRKITYSKFWAVRKFKEIMAVSICAQIGVFPVSLYYFHQFPGLFLLTNVVILPTMTLFMCGGILIVILSYWEALPEWLGTSYNFAVGLLNKFVDWVAMQEYFLFTDIHYSSLKVIATYFLIITAVLYFKKMDFRKLTLAMMAVIVLIGIFIFDKYRTASNEVIVFHKNRSTIIASKNGHGLTVFKKDSTKAMMDEYAINSYRKNVGTKYYSEAILPSVFRVGEKIILVMDQESVFPKQHRSHIIILTNNPKINMNRMLDSVRPEQIIADGSNYPSFVKRWKKSCTLVGVPFHYTGHNGAFAIR